MRKCQSWGTQKTPFDATKQVRKRNINKWLVVSNIFYVPFHIWDVNLPIDELIFFKMVIAPPTKYIYIY